MRQRASITNEAPGPRRPCGFAFTTTGRPCAHLVAEGELYCRAGHPCVPGRGRPAFAAAPGPAAAPVPPRRNASRRDRTRRAAELLARSLSHDDAEADGICAERILADPAVALTFLGSPEAAPAARDAVIQRFGLVGALLVVGHEDRLRCHLAALADAPPTRDESGMVCADLERLVRHFFHLDSKRLAALLGRIDGAETGRSPDALGVARHRLHAAYAVAARDGNDASHHEYMESLNEVLRMTRPAMAS